MRVRVGLLSLFLVVSSVPAALAAVTAYRDGVDDLIMTKDGSDPWQPTAEEELAADVTEVSITVSDEGDLHIRLPRRGELSAVDPEGGMFVGFELAQDHGTDAQRHLALEVGDTGVPIFEVGAKGGGPVLCDGYAVANHPRVTHLSIAGSCLRGQFDTSRPMVWRAFTGIYGPTFDADEYGDRYPEPTGDVDGTYVEDTPVSIGSNRPEETPYARAIDDACDGRRGEGFSDTGGSVHAPTIRCIQGYDITKGKGDGTYDPAGELTFAQIATFLTATVEASGYEYPAVPDRCPGAPRHLHSDNIDRLLSYYPVRGHREVFEILCTDAGATVRRDQMALLTSAVLEYHAQVVGGDEDFYPDDDTNRYAREIDLISRFGVVSGNGDGSYGPDTPLNRAQMATFLARALDVLQDLPRT